MTFPLLGQIYLELGLDDHHRTDIIHSLLHSLTDLLLLCYISPYFILLDVSHCLSTQGNTHTVDQDRNTLVENAGNEGHHLSLCPRGKLQARLGSSREHAVYSHRHFMLCFLPLPYPLHRLDWRGLIIIVRSCYRRGNWGLVVGPLVVDERDQDDHVRRGGLVSYGCYGRVSLSRLVLHLDFGLRMKIYQFCIDEGKADETLSLSCSSLRHFLLLLLFSFISFIECNYDFFRISLRPSSSPYYPSPRVSDKPTKSVVNPKLHVITYNPELHIYLGLGLGLGLDNPNP